MPPDSFVGAILPVGGHPQPGLGAQPPGAWLGIEWRAGMPAPPQGCPPSQLGGEPGAPPAIIASVLCPLERKMKVFVSVCVVLMTAVGLAFGQDSPDQAADYPVCDYSGLRWDTSSTRIEITGFHDEVKSAYKFASLYSMMMFISEAEILGEDVGDLGEFNSCWSREQLVCLDLRPYPGHIDRLGVIDEEHRMGIAHADGDGGPQLRVAHVEFQGVHFALQRNVAPLEAGGAHIDDDQVIVGAAALDGTGRGIDDHMIAPGLIHQKQGDAARAVAAGFGHAAVGVADFHTGVGAFRGAIGGGAPFCFS